MKALAPEQKVIELTMNVYKQEFERPQKPKEDPKNKKGPLIAEEENYIDLSDLRYQRPVIETRVEINLKMTDVDFPVQEISRQILRNVSDRY